MISVAEALERVLGSVSALEPEEVPLVDAVGRILAHPVIATLTQPPCDGSAMDGYALRWDDLADDDAELDVVGEAPAGGAYPGSVGPGQAVRIFTGGPVPAGADTVLMQENTSIPRDGFIRVHDRGLARGRHIRKAGTDFSTGDTLLATGTRLDERHLSLAAAGNVPRLFVYRRPKMGILATGDELVDVGDNPGPNQIISSNSVALMAMARRLGVEAVDYGIARDNRASLETIAGAIEGIDLLVTLGGASVGEHDLIQDVLGENGLQVDFWKIAQKPGKPMISGRFKGAAMIGLPGNPVSALVCACLYVVPLLRKLGGDPDPGPHLRPAVSGGSLRANGKRQDHLRASLHQNDDGQFVATALDLQDSAALTPLTAAQCLIVRPAGAPAVARGDRIRIISLP